MRRSHSALHSCAWLLVLFALFAFGSPAQAQMASPGTPGSITGTIVDPSGALIPGATVNAERSGAIVSSATTDSEGHYTITGLVPGDYTVDAIADGFRETHVDNVHISPGVTEKKSLTLPIEVQQQQTVVTDNDFDSSPESNGGAIVIKGAAVDSLSSDPTELQDQLQALAGPSPDGSGPDFYVDGFSGGKLPPKSAIREIRINQNPYSAQYDKLGFGRIEIFTKPGGTKLHADYWMQGNDSSFNTHNPFVTNQPPYYSYMLYGDINGPITKLSGYYADIYHQHGITDSVVNAVVLDSNLNQVPFTQAVASPTNSIQFNPRYDLQIGKIQTLTLRYSLQRTTQTNGGIGQFALASQAYNSDNTEQSVQISDTQMYGTHVVNETRFQYIRDRNNQNPVNTTPTIVVQGGFTGGGNNTGVNRDNQDHYEFQDYLQIEHGKHNFNIGARLRDVRDANVSTANFNGEYTFASIGAYQITERELNAGVNPTQIRLDGGGASLFTQTQGKTGIVVSVFDAGIYAEDDWKPRANLTLSYGLRFESQTQMSDHDDFGPRFGVAYSIPGPKNKPPRAVLRGGYGLFYSRFASTNVLQAKRQNGIEQVAYSVNLPNFYPSTCTADPSNCGGDAQSSPTVFSIDPFLRAPYVSTAGFSADVPAGKHLSFSANYIYNRGVHLFLTRNINAPLPGTYNVNDPTSGTRPLGTDENIYQYESRGASSTDLGFFRVNVHSKSMGFFGGYVLSKAEANTAGISSFPSNPYNLHVDYGRSANDMRNRVFAFGYAQLPWHFNMHTLLIYNSSKPFNITVGEDLNGDTQFNDRPAFATDLTRASVYRTKWGVFDSDPITGQKIIPINYGKGPNLFQANLSIGRTFQFGPIVPDENPQPPAAPAKDGKDEKDAKAPAKPVKKPIERKYSLNFTLTGENLFNVVNLAPPVGVLGSPLFGESTALGGAFGSTEANRIVNLETSFRF